MQRQKLDKPRLAGIAALVLAIVLGHSAAHAAGHSAARPNFVVIYIDDLGYADLPPFGKPAYATPAISALAAEGRVFTDFQVSSAVCSASRAALLTGCYHSRVGIHGALGPRSPIGINPAETTLAELCRDAGYATACFGKWHLGDRPPFSPVRHGFDEYYGLPYSNDMWPNHPELLKLPSLAERLKRYPRLRMFENERVVDPEVTAEDQRQLTRSYAEHAVSFINRHEASPFFLYLAHSMVHVPLFASPEFADKSGVGLFGDVVAEVDWSVGQVMQALHDAGISDRTLVLLTSDNGPWLSYGEHAGKAAPLREGKGTSFEGGTRVPAIMRWPGRIPAGTTCDTLASTIDILPTFAKLIGAKLPNAKLDGRDIAPLMFSERNAATPHEFFAYYYADNQLQAIRDERWKLHFPHKYTTLGGRPGGVGGIPAVYDRPEIGLSLFDLDADVGESKNVADEHPAEVARLVAAADAVRQELGDTLTGRKGAEVRPAGRWQDLRE